MMIINQVVSGGGQGGDVYEETESTLGFHWTQESESQMSPAMDWEAGVYFADDPVTSERQNISCGSDPDVFERDNGFRYGVFPAVAYASTQINTAYADGDDADRSIEQILVVPPVINLYDNNGGLYGTANIIGVQNLKNSEGVSTEPSYTIFYTDLNCTVYDKVYNEDTGEEEPDYNSPRTIQLSFVYDNIYDTGTGTMNLFIVPFNVNFAG